MSREKKKESNERVGKEVLDASAAAEASVLLVIGYNDVSQLNNLWAERYARSGHDVGEGELVVAEREMNRTTWELSLVNLGYPKLQFDTSGQKLNLYKNLLTDLRLALSKPNGMNARQAVRIEQSDASVGKVLEVIFDLNSSHIEYHTGEGREVRLHWAKPATYVIDNDRLSADRFKQHYEPLKRMKVSTLTMPMSVFLGDVWVYFNYDDSQIRAQVFNQPGQVAAQSDPIQTPSYADSAVGFHIVAFPITLTQVPPLDKDWVVGLYAPSKSMKWTAGGYMPPMEYYVGGYVITEAATAQTKATIHAQPLQCSPLISLCDGGGKLEELQLMPAGAQATWGAEGTLRGELLLQDGKHHYKPPQSMQPAVRFNEGGDTFIPAAYRASLATPTATDIIKVTAGGQAAYATFVIRWVHPTHFIRVARHVGGLKLSLFYFNLDQEEKAVADSRVSWQVVAGNGSVTSGVFKPAANSPSPYSVVMGVDTSSLDEWRWGLTIIAMPMLDIDTLVDYYSR
ncbi:hypothetical protein [Pseudomonas sp. NPDC089547]|uniref:hypothetical protein n=1 Tax=Pseudomonas sp. NPDC089547 TaxID=3390652 RepID=UPI003CFBDCE7